jgi:ABC-type multidrug transport system fused ATPase/permease subunit
VTRRKSRAVVEPKTVVSNDDTPGIAAPDAALPDAPAPDAAAGHDADAAEQVGPRSGLAWIWSYWRPHRGFLVFLFIFTLVSSGVTIAYPMVFKLVLDHLARAAKETGGKIPEPAVHRVLLFLGAIAMGRFVAGFYPSFRAWMNLKIDVDVREAVFRQILRKDFRFFHRFATGDLSTRLMDDISEYPKIAWFSCSGIFRAVDAASRLVFCVAVMLLLNWRLTVLSLLPLPVMMYVIYRVRARLTEAGEAQQKAISTTNEMLEKTFSGIRIVKAFSAEPGQTRALGRILDDRIGVQYRLQRLWATITTFDTVASRIGQLVVLAVGGALAVRGEVTVGTLYAFFIYLDMLVQPMWDLPNLVVTSRQAFVSINREEELIRFPVEVEHRGEGASLPRFETLAFEGVRCAYEKGRPALEGISFQAHRGTVLAVVGPVASGKSTLLKLTAGLLLPSEGHILVNGRPLSEWRWDDYRTRIGYAPQDSLLFSESIRENVSMGRPVPPNAGGGDWVHRVLAVARMEDELAVLPLGTETVLGQKGSKVSGGQRQRISIARSLYGQPELLLLDDCTASLDAENEDRLWAGLRAVLPDATVLLVSHRLATIRRADRILVLDGGRLADQGTHDELATRCPVYRRFLEREEERARVTAAVGD